MMKRLPDNWPDVFFASQSTALTSTQKPNVKQFLIFRHCKKKKSQLGPWLNNWRCLSRNSKEERRIEISES